LFKSYLKIEKHHYHSNIVNYFLFLNENH
jgi:hypothetical protein